MEVTAKRRLNPMDQHVNHIFPLERQLPDDYFYLNPDDLHSQPVILRKESSTGVTGVI